MGGMNYHIEVRFEDGVVWIARIRRFNASSPPAALRDYIIQSEVATLMFLKHTNVPAPEVYDYALEGAPGNTVGVGYILMQKLPGKSLRWSIATPEQRNNVMSQMADIFIELHKHPFPLLGSLDSPGTSHIGAYARESLTNFAQSTMCTTGPFSCPKEYHVASITLILDLIIKDEIYSHRAVDAYLIHRFLLDLVPRVLPSTQSNTFYLKHADDKGDHILVDEKFTMTGIIDWEWAHTATADDAFNSPIGFLPVADFYNGKNSLGDDETIFAQLLEARGRQDLAQIVRNGRLQHRFAFCCGYDLADWDGFLGLFRGLREAVAVDEGLEWNEWKTVALDRYKDDSGLQLVLCKFLDGAPI